MAFAVLTKPHTFIMALRSDLENPLLLYTRQIDWSVTVIGPKRSLLLSWITKTSGTSVKAHDRTLEQNSHWLQPIFLKNTPIQLPFPASSLKRNSIFWSLSVLTNLSLEQNLTKSCLASGFMLMDSRQSCKKGSKLLKGSQGTLNISAERESSRKP